MPAVFVTLEEINRSVTSKFYYKIVSDILKQLHMSVSDAIVLYKGQEIAATDTVFNNANISTKDNLPTLASSRKIIVNIEENYDEDSFSSLTTNRMSSYPIFRDDKVDVYIAPVYIKVNVNIEFTYNTNSSAEATRIRDDIRIRLSNSRDILIHDFEYDVVIPEVVEDFIADVHSLVNRVQPQSLQNYFLEHSTNRVRIITDMANSTNAKIAIFERQVRIVGMFDFSSNIPRVDTDKDTNSHRLQFSYKIAYDCPRALNIQYPVMLCNRAMPTKYLDAIIKERQNPTVERARNLNYIGFGSYNLSHFEAHRQLEKKVDTTLPINIPIFDNEKIRDTHSGYFPIVSFLPQVDESDHKTLFNIKNLEPFELNSEFIHFITTTESLYATKPYKSVFYFGLHQKDKYFDKEILEILPDGTIKSTVALEIFKPPRVILSVLVDLSYITPEILQRLFGDVNLLKLYLTAFIETYDNYKNELSKLPITYNSFYRSLYIILIYFMQLSQDEVVKQIVGIFATNKYLYVNIINIIYHNFPELYRYLDSLGLIEHELLGLFNTKNYIGVENYGMRTVQVYSIEAYRLVKHLWA